MTRRVILFLLIFLLAGFSVIGYFFISNSNRESSITRPIISTQRSLIPNSDINLGGVVKPLVSGFFGPKNNDRGDRVVTVVGQLRKVILGPGNDYSFELVVVNNGKNYTVSVDLGPKDFLITEYTATATEMATGSSAVKITQTLSGIAAQNLFEKYKEKVGQMMAFDIVTTQPVTPTNCDAQCTTKLSLYQTYAKNNKLLETPDSIESNGVLQVGIVSQMTGGSYVL